MTRLINANDLIKAILDFPDCENGYSDAYDKEFIISEVEAQPTIDAVHVVHGRWMYGVGVFAYACACSECKMVTHSERAEHYKFCPNCGARMDGEGREE